MNLVLSMLWAGPLLVGLWLWWPGQKRQAPRLAVAVSAAALLVSALVFVSTEAELLADPALQRAAVAGFAVDGLSAVLLPLVGAQALLALAGFPRMDRQKRGPALILLALAGALGALLSVDLLSSAAFGLLSLLPLWLDAADAKDAAQERAARWLLLTGALPLLAGTAAAAWWARQAGVAAPYGFEALRAAAAPREAPWWVGGLFVAGAVARLAALPAHSWLPALLERGRAPLAALVGFSPLGSFALARFGLELFPASARALGPLLLGLGALSAVYGALLALGQHDARRQLGFVGVSLGGFVLAGLASAEPRGLGGALFHAVAITLVMPGLLLCVRAVEARTGTADMRRLGGLVGRLPGLAAGYLLLGLAAVGFPGLATFASEDLLLQGLLREHAPVAVALLAAGALNGVSLVRSYKRIFLGPPSRSAPSLAHVEGLLARERLALGALAAALVLGGLWPTPLLAIREGVIGGPLRRSVEGASVDPHHAHPPRLRTLGPSALRPEAMAPAGLAGTPRPEQNRLRMKRALLVYGGPNAWAVKALLELEGFDVLWVSTPSGALEPLATQGFHLLVYDLDLPRAASRKAIQHARLKNPDVRVIVATSDPKKGHLLRRVTRLDKPMDSDLLATLLRWRWTRR